MPYRDVEDFAPVTLASGSAVGTPWFPLPMNLAGYAKALHEQGGNPTDHSRITRPDRAIGTTEEEEPGRGAEHTRHHDPTGGRRASSASTSLPRASRRRARAFRLPSTP